MLLWSKCSIFHLSVVERVLSGEPLHRQSALWSFLCMCMASEMAIDAQKANTERRFSRQSLYNCRFKNSSSEIK